MEGAATKADFEAGSSNAHQRRSGSFSWRGQVAAVGGVDVAT